MRHDGTTMLIHPFGPGLHPPPSDFSFSFRCRNVLNSCLIGPGSEPAEDHHPACLAAQQQCLGRPAGCRPALDERVNVGFGIDPQNKHPRRLTIGDLIKDGNGERQIGNTLAAVLKKILQAHLAGAQDIGDKPGDGGALGLGIGRDHQPGVALDVEQPGLVILVIGLEFPHPLLKLLPGVSIRSIIQKAPHQSAKGSIFEQKPAIPQTLVPILGQLPHLQPGHCEKGLVNLPVIVLLVIPIGQEPRQQDAGRYKTERESKYLPPSFFIHTGFYDAS